VGEPPVRQPRRCSVGLQMKAPQITSYDVDAANRTLEVAKELEEYAMERPDGTVSADKMGMVVEVLRGLHSTLSVISVHQERQRKKKQNHSLEAFADD